MEKCMFRKSLVFVIIMLFVVTSILPYIVEDVGAGDEESEAPDIEWSKTYIRNEGYETAYSMVKTSDGGFALAGVTGSGSDDDMDFWLVKTDSEGDKLWSKTYGGSDIEVAYSVVETSDGGFALAGTGFLVKTDSEGNELWSKTYSGIDIIENSLVETSDGGFALAGYESLVKTDGEGNELWSKTYGESDIFVTSLVETSDGGFAVAGVTSSGDKDLWFLKTDGEGNELWSKTYGENYPDEAWSLIETSDGGFALAGSNFSNAGGHDFWLVKTDGEGNELWSKTYGGSNQEQARSVIETSDGGFALAGFIESDADDTDLWLVKTNSEGDKLWSKTYGGSNWETACSVVETSDGGFALGVSILSSNSGHSEFLLVKLEGYKEEEEPKDDTPKNGDIRIISTEQLEGIYDPKILYKQIYWDGTWYDFEIIKYTKNGEVYTGAFKEQMKDALDWIRYNAPEDCTVLCWWDYGHMIEGYAERNAMAVFASLSLKDTIADYNRLNESGKQEYEEEHEWCSEDIIEDIATVITSESMYLNDVKNIVESNDIKYILTRGYDKYISEIFFEAADKEASEYVVDGIPTSEGGNTLIFRMWENNPEIDGLELVEEYESSEDENYDVRIFQIKDDLFEFNIRALLIGCWNYLDCSEPAEYYDAFKNDINSLKELLWKGFEFDISNIDICRNPDIDEINENLDALINEDDPDLKILYYTGHAYKAFQNEGLWLSGDCNNYWDWKLGNKLNKVSNLCCIFDTCLSGGLCHEMDGSSDTKQTDANKNGINGNSKLLLMSSKYNQPTQFKENSYFTWYIVEAFTHARNNAIDLIPGDKTRVSLEEAFQYAKEQTEIKTSNEQQPEIYDTWPTKSYKDEQFYLSNKPINEFWAVKSSCPVHLHVYDENYNHVGLNESGRFENEIPGIIHSGTFADENELVVVFNPKENDNIKFVVEAYDDGNFTLRCKDFSDRNKSIDILYENISIVNGSEAHITVQNNIFNNAEIDDDGDGISDRIISPVIISTETSDRKTDITPGFEFILLICGVVLMLFLKKRKKS